MDAGRGHLQEAQRAGRPSACRRQQCRARPGEGYRFLMAAPVRSYAALDKGLKLRAGGPTERRMRERTGASSPRSGLLPARFLLERFGLDSRPAMADEALPSGGARSRRPTPANAAMGQTGMPDTIRITVEGSGARPQRKARSRASTMHEDGYETPFTTRWRSPHDRDRHLLAVVLGTAAPTMPAGRPMTRRSKPILGASWRSTGTSLRRLRSRWEFFASPSLPRSCWCAPAAASPT